MQRVKVRILIYLHEFGDMLSDRLCQIESSYCLRQVTRQTDSAGTVTPHGARREMLEETSQDYSFSYPCVGNNLCFPVSRPIPA